MPPSTLTYVRMPGSVFTVPTVYRVIPAVATMDRPGSAEIRTAGSTPVRAHTARGRGCPLGLRRGRLPVDVGNTQATSDDELGETERGEEAA